MFLKIGNDYFNTAQIKRIRPSTKKDDPEQYAVAELLDGQMSMSRKVRKTSDLPILPSPSWNRNFEMGI